MIDKEKTKLLKEKTVASLIKHSDDIYSLTCYVDYDLDYVLSQNVKSAFKYFRVMRRIIHERSHYLKTRNFACSTFDCFTPDKDHLMGRNFDYRDSPCLVVKTSPKNGYRSIGITDLNFLLFGYKKIIEKKKNKNILNYAPYFVVDGINEKGLSIAVLELNDKPVKQKNKLPPLMTLTAIRGVLDKCASVDEALKFLSSHDMYSSIGYNYHFQITDKIDSVIVEYVNNKMRIIKKDKNNFLALTNYYLSEDGNNKKTHGQDRYEILINNLKENKGILTEEKALELLNKVKQDYHFVYKLILRYNVKTVYSAIYNTTKQEVYVSKNNKGFRFSFND